MKFPVAATESNPPLVQIVPPNEHSFGSGELPKPLETGELILAERRLTEGTLRILGRGDGHHEARLEPHADLQAAAPPSSATEPATVSGAPAAVAADLDQRGGRTWWGRMFAARVFTVAELAHVDERTVIPDPWTRRRVSPATAQPGERAAILTDQRIRFPRGPTRYSAAGSASVSATSSAGTGV